MCSVNTNHLLFMLSYKPASSTVTYASSFDIYKAIYCCYKAPANHESQKSVCTHAYTGQRMLRVLQVLRPYVKIIDNG